MNKFFALILFVPVLGFAAPIYNCSFAVSERVIVAQVKWKCAGQDTQGIDFSNGVPKDLVLSTDILIPDLFKSNFSEFQYSASCDSNTGYVDYIQDYLHESINYTINTDKSLCHLDPLSKKCFLQVNVNGQTRAEIFQGLDPKDEVNKDQYLIQSAAYIDDTGSLNLSATLMKGPGSYGRSDVVYPVLPKSVDTTVKVLTGWIDASFPARTKVHSGEMRTDSLRITCHQ